MRIESSALALLMILAGVCGACAADAQTYACIATLESMHQDGAPSFQYEPDPTKATFVLQIGRTVHPDAVWCNVEKQTGFGVAYCKFPFQAAAGQMVYYGEDTSAFRGYFPYDYFELFDDNHFIWSRAVSSGVDIQSGVCQKN